MSRLQLDALLAESAPDLDTVDRDRLREELGSLLTLVDDSTPAPSPELAAVLGLPAGDTAAPALSAVPTDGLRTARGTGRGDADHDVEPVRRLTGPRGAVTGAVVLAVATVGATGLSAAANSLPAPLQQRVSDLSRTYLPFDFPPPHGAFDGTSAPEDRPATQSRAGVPAAPLPGDPRLGAAPDARVPTMTRGEVTRSPQDLSLRSEAPTGASRPATVPDSPATSPRPSAGAPSPADGRPAPSRPARGQVGSAPEGGSSGDSSPVAPGPAPTSGAGPSPGAAPAPQPAAGRTHGRDAGTGRAGTSDPEPREEPPTASPAEPRTPTSNRPSTDPATVLAGTGGPVEHGVGTVGRLGPD